MLVHIERRVGGHGGKSRVHANRLQRIKGIGRRGGYWCDREAMFIILSLTMSRAPYMQLGCFENY